MSEPRARTAAAGPALAALGSVFLSAWAPAVLATPAQVVTTVHMRAGPSIEYPAFAVLVPGTPLEVFGCEDGYQWCDVQAGPNRGWVDAAYLQMYSGDRPLIVADSGVVLALPMITFVLDSYWGSYYRARPWYSQRARYHSYWNRYPHGRPPPGPRPPVVRPPPRPQPGIRPPVGTRPPPNPGRPPGSTRPPPNAGRPPGSTGPSPNPGRPPGSSRPPPKPGEPSPDSGKTRPAPPPPASAQ